MLNSNKEALNRMFRDEEQKKAKAFADKYWKLFDQIKATLDEAGYSWIDEDYKKTSKDFKKASTACIKLSRLLTKRSKQ